MVSPTPFAAAWAVHPMSRVGYAAADHNEDTARAVAAINVLVEWIKRSEATTMVGLLIQVIPRCSPREQCRWSTDSAGRWWWQHRAAAAIPRGS